MVRTRRYIYSPRDEQYTTVSSKEKRLSLLNRSRKLSLERNIIEQSKKKFQKIDFNKSKETLQKTPNNTSIDHNKTIKKASRKIKKSKIHRSKNSNISIKLLNNSFEKMEKKSKRYGKRKHSCESNSEKVIKKKKRKIDSFFTSTPLNTKVAKRIKYKKNKRNRTNKCNEAIENIQSPLYNLNSTVKLTDHKNVIDITSPQPEKPEFFTLSETPINQHLNINLTPNVYKQCLQISEIIEIEDDDEAKPNIDYVDLLSPSTNEDALKDDDSVIIIDEISNKSAGTQITPKSSFHDVIEIGTQMTPFQNNVSTNTSATLLTTNVFGTKSIQTVTNNNNINVISQSTATSIMQISKNVATNVHQQGVHQHLMPQNFSFQSNNQVISDFVQRIKHLEDQFIKHALLPSANEQNNRALVNSNEFGNNFYNPNRVIKRGLRLVVIDGSNVAMGHSNGKFFSCEGLKICIDYFVKRGHEVKAFVPQYRRQHHQSSNPKLLEYLAKLNFVIFTPSRQVNGRLIIPYDDRYIVQCAAEQGGVIVSNDNYRDLLAENPAWKETISKRLLMWTWCGDMIMFPIDPCGRGGPSLDQFLRF